ncbi:class II aldolase/adducin N-terminal [Lipomyces kononenkoae]
MAQKSTSTILSSTTSQPPVEKSKTAIEALAQGGPLLAGIPSFSSLERQRAHQLEHMAAAFRVVRDPENPHTFWTNPLGRPWSLMRASDMVLVDYDGNTSRPVNAAGFLIHSALHKARPDVNAACHAHSPYGKAWSTFSRPLEMINQDACIFYGEAQSVYEQFGGKWLADSLGPKGKAMILTNHGLLTVGRTVDEAAYLFTLMERSCQVQLLVEAAAASGIPKHIVGGAEAEYTFRMTSDPDGLYCEFQPDLEVEDHLCNGDFRN